MNKRLLLLVPLLCLLAVPLVSACFLSHRCLVADGICTDYDHFIVDGQAKVTFTVEMYPSGEAPQSVKTCELTFREGNKSSFECSPEPSNYYYVWSYSPSWMGSCPKNYWSYKLSDEESMVEIYTWGVQPPFKVITWHKTHASSILFGSLLVLILLFILWRNAYFLSKKP